MVQGWGGPRFVEDMVQPLSARVTFIAIRMHCKSHLPLPDMTAVLPRTPGLSDFEPTLWLYRCTPRKGF